MSDVKRVDTQMAALAYQVLGEEVTGEVRTRMRQLPGRLRGGGLTATYVYLHNHSGTGNDVERAYGALARAIADHVAGHRLIPGGPAQMTPTVFLQQLTTISPTTYTRISLQIEALAGWLSRLATALAPPPPSMTTKGGDSGGQEEHQGQDRRPRSGDHG
ncbi:type III-B CRISPR module-associated protein Cmr5 [Nocardiopsis dassonvillei]|uniref:type III-B CRISPR module-associated protein Cmr5 n=1 Tax=Nocardiopsis dassonvillei TaxID=2014 RepID=UPI00200F7448|nr:type III-B CRISPR module-associated protein Cmr5 [Nocardiopsis dassonvillei]MCK9874108.1 type III-B CRISPR module-associated protein Cmr5 [Nocardiopsis dassonvillei]